MLPPLIAAPPRRQGLLCAAWCLPCWEYIKEDSSWYSERKTSSDASGFCMGLLHKDIDTTGCSGEDCEDISLLLTSRGSSTSMLKAMAQVCIVDSWFFCRNACRFCYIGCAFFPSTTTSPNSLCWGSCRYWRSTDCDFQIFFVCKSQQKI